MKYFYLILPLLLIGCTTTQDVPVQFDRNTLVVPEVPAIEQYPYEWSVITKDNVQDKLKTQPVIIGLSPDGYVNQTLSIAELRKYIQEQQAVLDAYKKYYGKDTNTINKPVGQVTQPAAKPFWKFW